MKTRLLHILHIFLAMMISCVGNHKTIADAENADLAEEVDFFVFDLENGITAYPKVATLNELVDSISYVPLETYKDALLQGGYKYAKIGDEIFINGGFGQQPTPIYMFDSLGKFVKPITHHGRGPNEVIFVWQWYANSNLEQINVVDLASKMVIVQTSNGERLTVGISTLQGFDRVPLNDSTFVSAKILNSRSTSDAYLYFIDRTGNIVNSISRTDELAKYDHETSEYTWALPYEDYWLKPDYKGDAIFHDIFNDTLYRVKSQSEITPHLVFNRGTLRPKPEDTHKAENKKKQVYFTSVMGSGDHVFLNYYYGGKIWCDLWSKHDGRLMIHTVKEKSGLVSDIFIPFALPDGSVIELQVAYADEDKIYGIMEALDACKFLPGVKEDDNPVIVVAKLKK